MQTEGKSLAQALVEVMKAVDYVPKSGRNLTQNYSYATDAEISDKVRKAMAAAGIVMLPRVTSHSIRQIQGKNGMLNVNTVQMDFTFIHAGSGESFTISTVGEGMDSGDKGCYKAQTGAVKYALLKSFQIPTRDDPEKDNGEEDPHQQRPATQQPRPTVAPQAAPQAAPPAAQQPAQTSGKSIRNPDEPCTEPQQRRLFALAKQAGLDMEDLGVYVKTAYKVTSSKQLTKGQISELMDDIENGKVAEAITSGGVGWATEVADEGAQA